MRDSGVEWLGLVPTDWGTKRLRYLCDVTTGNRDTVDATDEGAYPFYVRSQEVLKIDSFSADCDEAVLTPGEGDIGRIFHYATGRFDFHQRVYMMTNFRGITGRFFFYYLGSLFAAVTQDGSKKTTVDSLRMPVFKNFVLTVPSILHQKAITRHLDGATARIDTLVAKKTRFIELLREKRQALITHAVTKGLDAGVPMKDSGVEWLGKVPESWTTHRLATVFREVVRAGDPALPVLSLSIHDGISDDELDETERSRKVTLIEDRSKYKRVVPGDLAYNMMRAWQGAFGAVSVIGQVSPAYVVAEPKFPISTSYVELLLRTPMAIEEMRRFSRGIADFRSRLYWEQFRDLRICLPPPSEQDHIVSKIAASTARINTLIAKTERSIELLREHRTALITAAVTGKIDLRTAA